MNATSHRHEPRSDAVDPCVRRGALDVRAALVELPRDTGAHLAKVLRARSGDEVVLFNGDGREFSGAIEEVRGSRVVGLDRRGTLVGSGIAVPTHPGAMRAARRSHGLHRAKGDGTRRRAHRAGIEPAQRGAARRRASRIETSALARGRGERLRAMRPQSAAARWKRRSRCSATWAPWIAAAMRRSLRLVLEPERAVPAARSPQRSTSPAPCDADAQIAIGPEGGFAPEELEAFDLSAFARVGWGPACCAPKPRPLRPSSCCRRVSAICQLFLTIRREPPTLDGAAACAISLTTDFAGMLTMKSTIRSRSLQAFLLLLGCGGGGGGGGGGGAAPLPRPSRHSPPTNA